MSAEMDAIGTIGGSESPPLRGGAASYAMAAGAVLAATLLRAGLDPVLAGQAPYATFFVASVGVFLATDVGPASLTLGVGGLVGTALFVATGRAESPRDWADGLAGLVVYLATGGLALGLLGSLRRTRATAERRAADLREVEEEARGRRELWRATLRSLSDAVIAADRRGRINFLNAEAERLLGAGAAGRPLAGSPPFVGRDGPRLAEAIGRALRDGEAVEAAGEVLLADGGGGTAYLEVASAPIRGDRGGPPLGVVAVLRDVTSSRRAALELEEARLAAEAAGRAKDRFLAALSHELRTPLTPVLLAVTYLLEGDDVPAALRPTLEMVRRNVEQEARLIDDLLDVVQVRRGALIGRPAPVDAHDAIRRAVDACRDDLDAASIAPALHLDAPRALVQADPARLRQAVANLLRNAAKFGTPGGRVVVRTRSEPDGGPLEIEVADDGIGIAPDHLSTIFDAFEQGLPADAPRRGGLGLGLAIGRAIASGLGGSLEATSPGPGLGATFTLRIAARPSTPAPPAPARPDAPAPASASPRPTLRILLVEDDEPTRTTVAQVLRDLGHRVNTAESVASAGAVADAPIDLLISDIGLPDGTGLDVLRLLSARRPVRAIALSGFALDDDLRASRAAGFAEHLVKPIDLRALDAAIRRAAGAG